MDTTPPNTTPADRIGRDDGTGNGPRVYAPGLAQAVADNRRLAGLPPQTAPDDPDTNERLRYVDGKLTHAGGPAAPERDAHWRAIRNAIAFGIMATDEVWNGSSWDRNDGTSARLDDLTEQYLAQDGQPAGAPLPASAEQYVGPARDGQAYRYPEPGR